MEKNQAKMLLILYLVLAMVLVGLDNTYNLTQKVFGQGEDDETYGSGNQLTDKGFVIHIIVFAALAAVPFYFVDEYK